MRVGLLVLVAVLVFDMGKVRLAREVWLSLEGVWLLVRVVCSCVSSRFGLGEDVRWSVCWEIISLSVVFTYLDLAGSRMVVVAICRSDFGVVGHLSLATDNA